MSGALALPRDRLAHILGMLGSAHDGEALAAARMADRMRAAAGLSWGDIVGAGPAEAAPWRRAVARCQARPDPLTPWERRYLASLMSFEALSYRQMEILTGIAAKCGAP